MLFQDSKSASVMSISSTQGSRCYGCSLAAAEHCLTLLRALAMTPKARQMLCEKNLIQELVWNNLRKGTVQTQEEVRQLLCILTRDNSASTEQLCGLLTKRINLSLDGHLNNYDLGAGVRCEIALLAALVQKEDDCWELKLRYMMKLFLRACEDSRSPVVMESVILPCLKILLNSIKPAESNNKKAKDKLNVSVSTSKPLDMAVDVFKWLNKEPAHTFAGWKTRTSKISEAAPPPLNKAQVSCAVT